MKRFFSVLFCVVLLSSLIPICVANAENKSVSCFIEKSDEIIIDEFVGIDLNENMIKNIVKTSSQDENEQVTEQPSFWTWLKEEWMYFWYDVFFLTYIFVGGTLVNIFLGPLSWFQS